MDLQSNFERQTMLEVPRLTQKSRELVWGGLAAGCSKCGWERCYDPTATVHKLPTEEVSQITRDEFRAHRCEENSPECVKVREALKRHKTDHGCGEPLRAKAHAAST